MRSPSVLLSLSCALALGALPRTTRAQTADAILARVIEARGGATKIHALQSVRLTGHVALSASLSAPLVVEQRRPAEIREELIVQDKTIVRGYNGSAGWTIDPFGSHSSASIYPSSSASLAPTGLAASNSAA